MRTLAVLGTTSEYDAREWDDSLLDFCIRTVASLRELHECVQNESVDCVLALDCGIDRLEILETVHLSAAGVPVVFRGNGLTAGEAVRLIRAGAHHCFSGQDALAHLREGIDAAVCERVEKEKANNPKIEIAPWRRFLIGSGTAMEAVAETISLVGPRRCTVLISGETGTGKEMAARAIHAASPRSQHAMVAINCSALPHHLLEAELFGHTRGAFTGATNQRVGRFEQANKSTIFLDEIGDMPLDLQAKLLRVLQDREIQRLGSSETIKVDVRVLAATNVNLLERIQQGKFREDLYYRLNVVPLKMPPLRKRTSDIPALVSHFIQKICSAESMSLKRLAPEALSQLCAGAWPGNVRQLENSVEMAIAISGDRDVLYPKDFGLTGSVQMQVNREASAPVVTDIPLEGVDFDTAVSRFELAMLDKALRQSGGNKTAAAERLGIKRTTLIMKIRNFENSGMLLPQAS